MYRTVYVLPRQNILTPFAFEKFNFFKFLSLEFHPRIFLFETKIHEKEKQLQYEADWTDMVLLVTVF